MRLKVANSQLPLIVFAPCVVNEILALLDFSHTVVPSAPYVYYVVESYTIEGQTVLCFTPFIDSPACGKRFRLASAENFVINQDAGVIRPRHKFLNRLIFVSNIKRNCSKFNRLIY